jgi:hypothetical protein
VRNLSIKLYRIYVCYTNITLYIAFGIIRGLTLPAVGLGTYYQWIRGHSCIVPEKDGKNQLYQLYEK